MSLNASILTNIDAYSAKMLPKEIEMKTMMMWSFCTHSCKTLDDTTKLRFL
jgi:predicted membrane protein